MADKAKVGTMWLGGCSGCHLSIADFHESLLDVLELAQFEFSPVLCDTKYDEVPELDVLIVEGGIRDSYRYIRLSCALCDYLRVCIPFLRQKGRMGLVCCGMHAKSVDWT